MSPFRTKVRQTYAYFKRFGLLNFDPLSCEANPLYVQHLPGGVGELPHHPLPLGFGQARAAKASVMLTLLAEP